MIEGSFNAFAAGTFIYVAIVNIIDAELSRRNVRVANYVMSVLAGSDDQPMPTRDHDRVIKFVLVILGISLMALLVQWAHATDLLQKYRPDAGRNTRRRAGPKTPVSASKVSELSLLTYPMYTFRPYAHSRTWRRAAA